MLEPLEDRRLLAIDTIFLSTSNSGQVGSPSVVFRGEDILAFDTQSGQWSMHFDGSDVGLRSANIDALHLVDPQDPATSPILLSLSSPKTIRGLGRVDDSDIIQFTPTSVGDNTAGTFSMFLDGSTVGLTTSKEDIDAISIAPNGDLVISTLGDATVPGAVGTVSVRGEDLIRMPIGGSSWSQLFDGSAEGLTRTSETINGVHVGASGALDLVTRGAFAVPGLSGDANDIFECSPGPTCGSFAQLFEGTSQGLGSKRIDGISLAISNAPPAITTSGTPSVPENTTFVIDINATDDQDSEGSGLTYSKTGGADEAKFNLNAATGELSFISAPDFENPTDAGMNNVYDVQVTVTDSGGLTDVQNLAVTVTDVAEGAPVAVDDAYASTGNVGINVPAGQGVFANDTTSGATITAFDATSVNGGIVTMNTSTGAFTYDPPSGFTGTGGSADTFTYTLTNGSGSDVGTVSIDVTGVIWFIDNSAGGSNLGTLNNPFQSITDYNGSGLPDVGEHIFLAESNLNYGAALTLQNNQRLIGQGAVGTLDGLTGITLPTHSYALPTLGAAANPVIATSGGITLASTNTVRGVDIANTSGIALSGTNFGTLTIDDVEINGTGSILNLDTGTVTDPTGGDATFANLNTTANPGIGIDLNAVGGGFTVSGTTTISGGTLGIDIDGTPAAGAFDFGSTTISGGADAGIDIASSGSATFTFDSLSITNDSGTGLKANTGGTINIGGTASTINSTGGAAVDVTSTTLDNGAGGGGVTFTSLSANNATNGINLNTVTGSFTVTGTGTTAASGGTIQNTSSHAILLNTVSGISLKNVDLDNVLHHGIFGTSVTGFTLDNANISDTGNADDEVGIQFTNLLGTASITNTDILNPADHYIFVSNTSGTLDSLTITGSTFNDGAAEGSNAGSGIRIDATGSAVISSIQIGVRNDGSPCQQASGSCDVIIDSPSGRGIDIKAGAAASGGTITDVDIDNVRILDANAGGVLFESNGTGNLTATLRNSFVEANNATAVAGGADGDASGTYTIRDNTTRVTNSSFFGVDNIAVRADGNVATDAPTLKTRIDGNDIQGGDAFGINVAVRGSAGVGHVGIFDNTIANVGDDGIRARAGNGSAGETDTLHIFLDGNSSTRPYDLRDQSGATTFRLGCDDGAHAAFCGTRIGTSAVGDDQGVLAQHGNAGGGAYQFTGTIEIVDSDDVMHPLLASGGAVDSSGVADLTQEQLQPVVAEAIARWQATGLAAWQVENLEDAEFTITDLSGSMLGGTFIDSVVIDVDAAGHGWFIDATPGDDAGIAAATAGDASGVPADRIDLLTVVMHELGHLLQIQHNDDPQSVMSSEVATGTRLNPLEADHYIHGQPPVEPDGTVPGDLPGEPIPPTPVVWQNPLNHRDVNGDGIVTHLDALAIINVLNAYGAVAIDAFPDVEQLVTTYLDADGNGHITALDVIQIVNAINGDTTAPASDGEGESSGTAATSPQTAFFAGLAVAPRDLPAVANDDEELFELLSRR